MATLPWGAKAAEDDSDDDGKLILEQGDDQKVLWDKLGDIMDVQTERRASKRAERRASSGVAAASDEEHSSGEDSDVFNRPPAWRSGAKDSLASLTQSTFELCQAEQVAQRRRELVQRQLRMGEVLQPNSMSPQGDRSQRKVVRNIERTLGQMQSQRKELRTIIQDIHREPTVCTDHRHVDIMNAAAVVARRQTRSDCAPASP